MADPLYDAKTLAAQIRQKYNAYWDKPDDAVARSFAKKFPDMGQKLDPQEQMRLGLVPGIPKPNVNMHPASLSETLPQDQPQPKLGPLSFADAARMSRGGPQQGAPLGSVPVLDSPVYASKTASAIPGQVRQGQYAKATNTAIRAGFQYAEPIMAGAAIANPLAAAKGLAGFFLASKAGEYGTGLFTDNPDYKELGGNIAGLVGGSAGAKGEDLFDWMRQRRQSTQLQSEFGFTPEEAMNRVAPGERGFVADEGGVRSATPPAVTPIGLRPDQEKNVLPTSASTGNVSAPFLPGGSTTSPIPAATLSATPRSPVLAESRTEAPPLKALAPAQASIPETPTLKPVQPSTLNEAVANQHLAKYRDTVNQIKRVQRELSLAESAQQKGFERGKRTLEQMEGLRNHLGDLQEQADAHYANFAKTKPGVEVTLNTMAPKLFPDIGKSLQLHALVTEDATAKAIRRALNSEVVPRSLQEQQGGLPQEDRALLSKALGEDVGSALTPKQRFSLKTMLGYAPRLDANGNRVQRPVFLKFAQNDKFKADVEQARGHIDAQLANPDLSPQEQAFYEYTAGSSKWDALPPKNKTADVSKLTKARDEAGLLLKGAKDPKERAALEWKLKSNNARILAATDPAALRVEFYNNIKPKLDAARKGGFALDPYHTLMENLVEDTKDAGPDRYSLAQKAGVDPSVANKKWSEIEDRETRNKLLQHIERPLTVFRDVYGREPEAAEGNFTSAILPGELKEITQKNLGAILGKEETSRGARAFTTASDRAGVNLKDVQELERLQSEGAPQDVIQAHKDEMRRAQVKAKYLDPLVSELRTRLKNVNTLKQMQGIKNDPITDQINRIVGEIGSGSDRQYYSTLGVNRDATPEEIENAFHQKAKLLHPDVNKAPGATEQFQKVNEAYQVLKNKESRATYDTFGNVRDKSLQSVDARVFKYAHELYGDVLPGIEKAKEVGVRDQGKPRAELPAPATSANKTPLTKEERLGKLSQLAQSLRKGEAQKPETIAKVREFLKTGEASNAKLADAIDRYVNQTRGQIKAAATRAARKNAVQEPVQAPPTPPETAIAEAPARGVDEAARPVAPELTPEEFAARQKAAATQGELAKLEGDHSEAVRTLQSAVKRTNLSRLGRFTNYDAALQKYITETKKGDPWALKKAVDEARKLPPPTVNSGFAGLWRDKRPLNPQESQDILKSAAGALLSRYERMAPATLASHADRLRGPELTRMVEESRDPAFTARLEALRATIGPPHDPIESLMSVHNGLSSGTRMAGLMREATGNLARQREIVRQELSDHIKRWDSASIADSDSFIHNMETGNLEAIADPADRAVAARLRSMLDERGQKIEDLGKAGFIENYFPHIWQNVGRARNFFSQLLAKGPLPGRSDFTKGRFYDYYLQGRMAGLDPVTFNPIKHALLRLGQEDKFIMAHQVKDGMVEMGVAKFVNHNEGAPEGWVKITDSFFKNPHGSYYAPKDAAKIINNYLSPGLAGHAPYDVLRSTNNFLNQVNLGWSAFHGIETAFNATVSDAALALQKGLRGDITGALKASGRAFLPGASVFRHVAIGNKLAAEYMSPGTFAEYSELADMVAKSGGRAQMDSVYKNAAMENMRNGWKTVTQDPRWAKKIPAALKMPFQAASAATQFASIPIMDKLVPRVKLGVFSDLAQNAIEELGDRASDRELVRAKLDSIWDSVDNRFGQLVYDNRFWNKTGKDIAMVMGRSVGWNYGTLSELGGGLGEAAKSLASLTAGEKKALSQKTAYTAALVGTTAYVSAMLTYGYTGHGPSSISDYFFPPTGKQTTDGKPERHYIKTYVHDAISFYNKPLETIAHKTAPIWAAAYDVFWKNADYYGEEIRGLDDDPFTQAKDTVKYLARQAMPFSVQNALERYNQDPESGFKKTAESSIGLLPAPKWVNQSPAEQLANEAAMRYRTEGPRSHAEMEKYRDFSLMRKKFENGSLKVSDAEQALKEGRISDRQFDSLFEDQHKSEFQRNIGQIRDPKMLLKVWNKASSTEKDAMFDTMMSRFDNLPADDPMMPEFEKIAQRGPSATKTPH